MPLKLVEYECAEYKEEYSQTCRPEKRCQVGYLLFIEHRPVAVDDMRHGVEIEQGQIPVGDYKVGSQRQSLRCLS